MGHRCALTHQGLVDCKHLIVDTGDLLRPDISLKTSGPFQEQLCEGLKIALPKFTSKMDDGKSDKAETVMLPEDPSTSIKLQTEEQRNQSVVTVKIFPHRYSVNSVREAVFSALESSGASELEYVIFSLHPEIPLRLTHLQEMYMALEALVEKHIIKNIMLSEIMDEYFIAIYSWAKVKPGLQVFWTKDTQLPPTLANFVQEKSVRVLTHRDPLAILPRYILDITLMDIDHPLGENYSIHWLSRIEVLLVKNGKVNGKGCTIKFAY